MWEPLHSIDTMIEYRNQPHILIFSASCLVVMFLNACALDNSSRQSDQGDRQKVAQDSSNAEKSSGLPYKGNLLDVDGLLKQLEKRDANLELQSKRLLKVALDAQEDNDWGAAAKGFGESIVFRPTNEALLGYAMSQLMTNVNTLDQKETLKIKLRNFKEAIKIYQTTTEFSQRSGKPLSNEQKQLVKTNIACLESFLKSPNPKVATCKLVADALKASKIN